MMGYGTNDEASSPLLGSAPPQSMDAPSYQTPPPYPVLPHQAPQSITQQQGPFIHAYVMGSAPPSGPVCVYDIHHIKFDPNPRKNNVFESLPSAVNFNPPSSPSTRSLIIINYVLGILFIPHLISVIGSLHAYQTGQIVANRTTVLVLSFFEIAAWFLAACASWSFVEETTYSYYYPYEAIHIVYFGWVYIVLWFLVYLGCGIPRVYLSTKTSSYAPLQNQEEMSPAKADNCRRIALGLYIAGIFVSPLEIVSLGYTLYLLDKGQVVTNKAGLLACSVLELCGWIMGAALSWGYSQGTCYWHDNHTHCGGIYYWGWVFLIVWFSFAIACGIPRVVLMYRGKKPSWEQSQSYAL